MKAIVTGGAGFIGSHIVDKLVSSGYSVTVLDNLRSGSMNNISHHMNKKENFLFVKCDLTEKKSFSHYFKDCDIVFHFAANPEVRIGVSDTDIDFHNNIVATRNVMEACREYGNMRIVFASTSTVYGEPKVMPTPEDYGPMIPISMYGASKAACEALVSGYCHMFDLQAYILRLANVIGPRSNHGVIYDFLKKLTLDSKRLEILGDGTQTKSYLYITDCIDAIFYALQRSNSKNPLSIYNIGSLDKVDVVSIANIVISSARLHGVKLSFSDTQGNGRGWKGDVKEMLLDVTKLADLGWHPKFNSAEAVRETAEFLCRNIFKFS